MIVLFILGAVMLASSLVLLVWCAVLMRREVSESEERLQDTLLDSSRAFAFASGLMLALYALARILV